jgi:two-component system, LytTR family, response regulator
MYRCLIIDDEQHTLDLLSAYARQSGLLDIVATLNDPLQALPLLSKQEVDVVFLDVNLSSLSGLDFIRAAGNKLQYVLCTAHSEYASEAFELGVADYLLKPVRFSRFMKAIGRLGALTHAQAAAAVAGLDDFETDYMFVKTETKGKLLKVNVRDIELVEGMRNYIAIHHNGLRTLALLSIKEMEDRLPARYFMRVHKSFLVNLERISGIAGNQVYLKNSTSEILIGASYKEAFMERMKERVLGK